MIRSERTIYQVIEEILKKAKRPMTCNDLWDNNEQVRELEHEGGVNKISDYLGFMWRKGLISRYPAPKTSTNFARFAYIWKQEMPAVTKPSIHRDHIEIQETKNGVVIALKNVEIIIKSR